MAVAAMCGRCMWQCAAVVAMCGGGNAWQWCMWQCAAVVAMHGSGACGNVRQ